MELKQLHCINQIYVQIPDHNVPHDVCPRVEIADPYKLMHVATDTFAEWSSVTLYDSDFVYRYVHFPETHHCYDKVVNIDGFYILTTEPDIFYSIPGAADDEDIVYTWLLKWAHKYFMVTCPIIDGHYSVSNMNTNKIIPIIPTEDAIHQLIVENCYTLCNGLTLLLALLRLHMLDDLLVINVLSRFFGGSDDDWYAPIPQEYFNIYVSNPMPQISEFPFLYACMGKQKASRQVMEYLNTQYDFLDRTIITGNVPRWRIYYTSFTSAAFPYVDSKDADFYRMQDVIPNIDSIIPLVDDNYYHTIDLGGFLRNIVATKGMWKWWNRNQRHRTILTNLINAFETPLLGATFILKRLFQLYNESVYPPSRLRKIWKEVCFDFLDKDDMLRFMHKYMSALLMKVSNGTTVWLPQPPVSFLLDVATRFDIFYENNGVLNRILCKFNTGSHASIFKNIMRNRATSRLLLLKEVCKNKWDAWDALKSYIKHSDHFLLYT